MTIAYPSKPSEMVMYPARLFNIYFDSGSVELNVRMQGALDSALHNIVSFRVDPVKVTGHTDEAEASTYAPSLSLRRAEAVRDYLVAAGLDPQIFVVTGVGDSRPFTLGSVDDAYNRRVDVSLG